jgi:hypothetical protein
VHLIASAHGRLWPPFVFQSRCGDRHRVKLLDGWDLDHSVPIEPNGVHPRTSLWSSRSPFPRKSDFGGQRQSGHNVRGGRAREIQRPSGPDGRRRYGVFGAGPGNLRRAATDWWSNEDSNQEPGVLSTALDGSVRDRGRGRAGMEGCRHRHRLYRARQPLGKRLHRELQRASPRRTPRRRDILLVTLSANRHRELAASLQSYQAARARGVHDRARHVTGCATSNGSAGHAGAQANLKLTSRTNQWGPFKSRAVATWWRHKKVKR